MMRFSGFGMFVFFLSGCTVAPKKTASSQEALIRDCPEEKVVNKMPLSGKGNVADSYFIYKGKRKEIKEFDAAWLEKNCEIKETVVY